MGFTLARLQFLSFSAFCDEASPGECFYFKGKGYVGLYLHLGCILRKSTYPSKSLLCEHCLTLTYIAAALLACLQFVPAIRHKIILFHRINGYVIITLVLISNVGALMIARNTFGGFTSTQASVGMLVIISTAAIAMGYYNVKRLQLEQHRAWMMRAFFYVRDTLFA